MNTEHQPTRSDATTTIHGSHGTLFINPTTGLVTSCQMGDADWWARRFDVQEYLRHYGFKQLPDFIDVLDIGYWDTDGKYTPPERDYRNEIAAACS